MKKTSEVFCGMFLTVKKKHWQINPYDSGSIYFSGCKEWIISPWVNHVVMKIREIRDFLLSTGACF